MTQSTAGAEREARDAVPPRHAPRPVILITPDLSEKPGLPTETEYVVRANYIDAIVEAGGVPLILPYDTGSIAETLALADGIVLTGTLPGIEVADARRRFERRLIDEVLRAQKPLLGICHGMQLIGEYLGGSLVSELPVSAISHQPRDVPDEPAHAIVIEPDSLLARLAEAGPTHVNSLHRHALTGEGRYRVAARAPDGIIEAFEGETDTFCLGIQWHPEYRLTELDVKLLRAFVDRSAEAAARKASVATHGGAQTITEKEEV